VEESAVARFEVLSRCLLIGAKENQYTSVRIAGFLTKIRNKHIPNIGRLARRRYVVGV